MTRSAVILGLTAVLSAAAVSCKSEEPSAWAPVQGRVMSRWAAEGRPKKQEGAYVLFSDFFFSTGH